MKRILILMTAGLLMAAGARAGTFTNFTSSRYYTDVVFDGNIMWAATQGGLVKHDLDADTFRVYTTQDGLPDNYLAGIARDMDGNIWSSAIGKAYVSFDGTAFTTYNEAATGFIQSRYSYPVFAGTDGTVWSVAPNSTPEVLTCDGMEWTLYDTADGLPDGYGAKDVFARAGGPESVLLQYRDYTNPSYLSFGIAKQNGSMFEPHTTTRFAYCYGSKGIRALLNTEAQGLTAGSIGALSRYSNGQWHTFSTTDIPADITHLAEGGSGTLWAATAGGIYSSDGTGWTLHDLGDTVNTHLTAVYADRQGGVWAAYYYRDEQALFALNGTAWNRVTAADGLRVYGMVKGTDGTLWLATSSGVAALNGISLTLFTTADGLPSNSVAAVAIDSTGATWCATSSGAARYSSDTWTAYTTADGLVYNRVNAISTAPDGSVWFATSSGISKRSGSSFQTVLDGALLDTLGSFYALCPGTGDTIFAGGSKGLARHDGTRWTILTSTLDYADIHASAGKAALDDTGVVWIATSSGLVSFDGTDWHWRTAGNDLPSQQIKDVHISTDGTVWCASDSGVFAGDGTLWNIYGSAEGMGSVTTRWITETPDDRIIAGHADGFSVFNGSDWHYYETRPDGELYNSYLIGITVAPDGEIWTVHPYGVTRVSDWSNFLAEPQYWTAEAAIADNNGRILLSTPKGIIGLESGIWTPLPVPEDIITFNIREMALDSSGNLWCIMGNNGGYGSNVPYVYDGMGWTAFDTLGTVEITTTFSMALDQNDNAYFNVLGRNLNGTWNGSLILKYDGTTWTTIDSISGSDYQSSQLSVDKSGNLWRNANGYYENGTWHESDAPDAILRTPGKAVTDENGIMWFDIGTGIWAYDGTYWVNYTTAQGLVDNDVTGIVVDADNRKWIATSGGLSILEENQLDIHEFLSPEQTAALVRLSAGPNPFRSSLTISLEQLNANAPVTSLRILNQAGATVTELPVTGSTVRWNGRNASGIEAPVGVYFAQPSQGENGAAVRIIKTE